jgi:hypothetical protein
VRRAAALGAAIGLLAAALAVRPAGAAGAPGAPGLVLVPHGIHRLKLDGQVLLAVRARRENYNAHSFDVLSFYTGEPGRPADMLNLVPIFGAEQGKEKERYAITVSGGADCLLQDFRLVQASARQPARLVIAERDFGASFVAPGTVHFTYYALTRNTDQSPGRPALYFQASARTDSKQAYCDVNEAFDRELHLGRTSGAGV